jgi:hypothetical protein
MFYSVARELSAQRRNRRRPRNSPISLSPEVAETTPRCPRRRPARHASVAASESLERIRRALEQHTPWVTLTDTWLLDDDFENVLRAPHIDDYSVSVTEDMSLCGRHLGYRIAALSDGAIAVVGLQLDRRESPRVLIRHESRWKSIVWFIWLMEVNRVRSLWRPKPWHLKDQSGKTVLSVA